MWKFWLTKLHYRNIIRKYWGFLLCVRAVSASSLSTETDFWFSKTFPVNHNNQPTKFAVFFLRYLYYIILYYIILYYIILYYIMSYITSPHIISDIITYDTSISYIIRYHHISYTISYRIIYCIILVKFFWNQSRYLMATPRILFEMWFCLSCRPYSVVRIVISHAVTVCVSGVETCGCNVTVFDGRRGEGVGKCEADWTGAFIWIASSAETVSDVCRQMSAAYSRRAVQNSGVIL
jgi:hypothetical protein